MGTEFSVDGKTYELRTVAAGQRAEARSVYNRAFHRARKDGCFLRSQLLEEARKAGIWNEEKERELAKIEADMAAITKVLDEGGIELEAAKEKAMELIGLRSRMIQINMEYAAIDAHTAERQAEAAQEEFELSQTIFVDGKPYCSSLDDFYSKESDPVIIAAMAKRSMLANNLNEAFLAELPEYKFLQEFGFMDSDFRLIGESQGEEPPKERKPFLKDGKPLQDKSAPVEAKSQG